MDFIDSLQESNRKKEKERCILEVRNKAIEPQDPDIIPKMIANLHKWFGKTKTDQFFGAWKDFIEIKLTDGKTIEEFIIRFDTIDSKLKSTNEALSQRALACHMIYKLDLEENQKQNILASIKFENNPNVYEDVKSSIHRLKGSLVRSSKKKLKSMNPGLLMNKRVKMLFT